MPRLDRPCGDSCNNPACCTVRCFGPLSPNQALLAELARVKVLFQLRTIATVMGIDPNTIRQEELPSE